MDAKTHTATMLMSRLLFGLSATNFNRLNEEEPDFGASQIEEIGPGSMAAKIHLPAGDTFIITVSWVSEESP